jgi:hypothetical protein
VIHAPSGAVVAVPTWEGQVSRHGKRSHTTNEQNVTRFTAKRHLRVVKDELAESQPLVGGAMSLAPEECSDDRPPKVTDGPGAHLRRRREAHGLTLDDLSRITKITRTSLVALETSDVRRLPAAIYTRGFVKAYAREVGLDPARTADEYLAALMPMAAQLPVDEAGHLPPVTRPADAPSPATNDAGGVLADHSTSQFGWVTTIVAVIGLIAYLAYLGSSSGNDPQEAPAATVQEPAAPDAARAAQDDTLGPDATRAAAGPLRLELRTQGLCWVVISVDGEQVLARLLRAGEHHTFDVENEAVMRVGDPAALTLMINGQPGRRLGAAEEPVDVRITTTNFQEYLGAR